MKSDLCSAFRISVSAAAVLTLIAGCAVSPTAPSGAAAQPSAAAPAAAAGTSGVTATTTAAPGSAANPAAGAAARAPAAAAPGAAAAPAVSGAAAAAPARPAADPSAPRPFAEVIKDAKREDGLFPIWRKDEKVWLEIPAVQIGKPFMFSANVGQAVGERGLYASQMGVNHLVEWRRVGNQLQLIALNTRFRAEGGSARAVGEAFSPSLLASSAVASADHPERKAFLVDAANLFLQDISRMSTRLESAYRLPYAVDRANSSFSAVRADASIASLSAQLHFATPRIPAPPATPGASPAPTPPQATPDPRSLFMTVVYSMRALPEKPMAPRLADPRLGHFTESYTDLGEELKPSNRVHLIKRWRLEKKDPNAEMSEPVQPIVFWMDKNIPPRYRGAVEAGIVEWNKAFEKIGFKGAVVARQQPDDANWDNMDATHASIRWFVGADVGFAIGPSHADPRTGEILDADIGMSDVFGRGARRLIVEDVRGTPGPFSTVGLGLHAAHAHGPEERCTYADDLAAEAHFALELLEARGDIAPDSPEAEAMVQAVIKDTIMHEVGHTLGLKHNFKASTTITRDELKNPSLTASRGISGSVMDYNAYNLPLAGEVKSTYNMATLGAYDYWAIEYAYRPIPGAQEKAVLQQIAGRSTEPALAYADDADAGGGLGPVDGFDPLANRFDLGDDPLAWYQRRIALSKELWARIQERPPVASEDPQRTRRSLLAGFRQLRDMPVLAAKYVGGLHAVRDLPGSARANFKPVDPAKQREALNFLAKEIFSADSFRFKPEFLTSLAPDYNEWENRAPLSIPAQVLGFQTQALDRLMSGATAQRLLDLPLMVPAKDRKGIISLNEVYGKLQSAVWSELGGNGEIDRMRRNLQREHLRRVQQLLTRGAPGTPADAISLVRMQATRLQADLERAVKAGGGGVETQAHLRDSLSTLTEALRATMQRM